MDIFGENSGCCGIRCGNSSTDYEIYVINVNPVPVLHIVTGDRYGDNDSGRPYMDGSGCRQH